MCITKNSLLFVCGMLLYHPSCWHLSWCHNRFCFYYGSFFFSILLFCCLVSVFYSILSSVECKRRNSSLCSCFRMRIFNEGRNVFLESIWKQLLGKERNKRSLTPSVAFLHAQFIKSPPLLFHEDWLVPSRPVDGLKTTLLRLNRPCLSSLFFPSACLSV